MNCLEKLIEYMENIDIEEMDCDTCLKMQEILREEIDDPEFPHQIIHVHHARPICGTPCLFTPDCGEAYI